MKRLGRRRPGRFALRHTRAMQRWRGLKSLVHQAVDAVVDLVDEGHESTARNVIRVTDVSATTREPARAVDAIRRFGTRGVLGTIKVVNRAVEKVTDVGLDVAEARFGGRDRPGLVPALPMRSDVLKSADWIGDAGVGLVNAALGDHLHAANNGLDMGMMFRAGDFYVRTLDRATLAEALPNASPRVALFVHGLGTTEWSWCLEADAYFGDPTANFGSLLAKDTGITPIWLRYNTGRHVSSNGRELAQQLERFVDAYPVPIEELILIGHSMGGLVVRSACHYATAGGSESRARWIGLVRRVISLGSPHHGAPLAKLGAVLTTVLGAIDLPGTLVTSRVLEGRSAGIKDLRHGSLVDEDWLDKDPDALDLEGAQQIPLLPGVAYSFVSATITRDPAHPLGRLIGDLLVRVPSSTGSSIEQREFAIDTDHFGGVMHHQLQNHPAIYEVVRAALTRP
jgi:pimeloyl-ACP methyl ester carboxylesterase